MSFTVMNWKKLCSIDVDSKVAGATIFGYHVSDPENYGVVEFDKSGKAVSLEEKPEVPKSKYASQDFIFTISKSVPLPKN